MDPSTQSLNPAYSSYLHTLKPAQLSQLQTPQAIAQAKSTNFYGLPAAQQIAAAQSYLTKAGGGDRPLPPSPTPGPAPAPKPAPGPSLTPASQSYQAKLLELLNQNPNDVSITSPDLKPQADAYRLATERSREEERAAMAERLSASGIGTNSGAFNTTVQQGYEQAGQSEATYNAQLVGQKLQERRAQVMQALQLGAGLLSQEQQGKLQLQLAAIDASLRQQGFALQKQLGFGGLNLGLLQTLLGNQQFNDKLGFDIGSFISSLNQNSIFAGLKG